jgi:hypothetical protein
VTAARVIARGVVGDRAGLAASAHTAVLAYSRRTHDGRVLAFARRVHAGGRPEREARVARANGALVRDVAVGPTGAAGSVAFTVGGVPYLKTPLGVGALGRSPAADLRITPARDAIAATWTGPNGRLIRLVRPDEPTPPVPVPATCA